MTLSLRDGNDSVAAVQPPLSQTVGYVVIVVVGLLFTFGMIALRRPVSWNGKRHSCLYYRDRNDTRHEDFEVHSWRG